MSTTEPGQAETIAAAADKVEADESDGQSEEEDFVQPSHWWFASTACPLLAGTFGPMASGFNICALVQYWRQTIPPGKHAIVEQGHVIPDPTYVVAVNVVSLACAVTGNASLLLNMARRLKFETAQAITISGFFLAGLLLIADTAALASTPHYGIETEKWIPPKRHALTEAFYYAIFAAAIYIIIALLMCFTVYGAVKGHYKKRFDLTAPQRTLMLQTMSFIAYLLLGALVYSNLEGWPYLDAVYWADVTLLTVGTGDYHPGTRVGRGLLFPFAIGGILMVGLVIGSIRSLILERGKEKLAARIVEKRRERAVRNVDDHKQTIKISLFAKADFSTDPAMSSAQRREEEFNVMRKVQKAAERERRWFSLSLSSTFALILWFIGAVIFMHAEKDQGWNYMESLYYSYASLMTIGYGDFAPQSNFGRTFFVFWSLLAVPSLTILISNMGDTFIKWFSDATIWIGSLTVLPEEGGFRATFRKGVKSFMTWVQTNFKAMELPGIMGAAPVQREKRMDKNEHKNMMLDRLAGRLSRHVGQSEIEKVDHEQGSNEDLQRDILFYNYVLARECRNLQKDLSASPPKQYEWPEWEFFLALMGNANDPEDFPGQSNPDIMVPDRLRAPKGLLSDGATKDTRPAVGADGKTNSPNHSDQTSPSGNQSNDSRDLSSSDGPKSSDFAHVDGNIDRETSVVGHMADRRKEDRKRQLENLDAEPEHLLDWSWLSDESPLMSQQSEAEWILDRLSAALERELNRQRKGYKRRPPIGLKDVKRVKSQKGQDVRGNSAEDQVHNEEEQELQKAESSE